MAELVGTYRNLSAPNAFLGIIATSRLLAVLNEDNREIFKAAAHAQRAADFLRNLSDGEFKPASRG